MAVSDGEPSGVKGRGLVSQVLTGDAVELRGDLGIGHNRYSTAGRPRGGTTNRVQPDGQRSLALGHNGTS